MRSFLSLVAVVLAGSAFAQEMPKPGKEHELLKKHEGTWEVTMTAGGQESKDKGTATYKMDLGGFWLLSTFEGTMEGQKFSGKGTDGYCPIKKKYVSVWTDSMSPSPVVMQGDFDEKAKTLTMTGEGPDMMSGKMAKYKSVTTYPDADTMVFSMTMGDAKEPMFTMTYKRKK
jgi:hypothetical protein